MAMVFLSGPEWQPLMRLKGGYGVGDRNVLSGAQRVSLGKRSVDFGGYYKVSELDCDRSRRR